MIKQYIYFGHHKCATRYIISILNHVCEKLSLTGTEYFNQIMFNNDLIEHLKNHPVDFLYYTNAKYEYAEPMINSEKCSLVAFHMIRDPRDIAISGYFSHLNSHPTNDLPELAEYRKELKSCTLEDGLMLEIKQCRYVIQDLLSWNYHNSKIMEVRYEQLIQNPFRIFYDILKHLELINLDEAIHLSPTEYLGNLSSTDLHKRHSGTNFIAHDKVNVSELFSMINQYDFKKLSGGRSQGIENKNHHYRKGISGDWKNYFSNSHKKYFKENYSDVLFKLGYENEGNW